MTFNPKIDSPCPYKDNLSAIMDGDFCRMCKRNVFDLNGLSDQERRTFLASCASEVCVSYTLPVKKIAAITAAAALLTPLPLAAQTSSAPDGAMADLYEGDFVIVVGGIKDPKATAKFEQSQDKNLAELPVVDETDDLQKPSVTPPKSS